VRSRKNAFYDVSGDARDLGRESYKKADEFVVRILLWTCPKHTHARMNSLVSVSKQWNHRDCNDTYFQNGIPPLSLNTQLSIESI
jgi:hypothetical protein